MKPLNEYTTAEIIDFVKKVDKKTWIKLAIGLTVFFVVTYIFILPAWLTRLEVKQKIKDLENKMQITQNLLRKQPVLLKDKERFLKVAIEAKEHLYQPGESSLLLGLISKFAQESQVSIVASTPKPFDGKFPPPFDAQYEASLYDFTVEGGYHPLATFISRIESHAKILRVQRYGLKQQEDNAQIHMADVGLSAVSFKKVAVDAT